MIKINKPYLSYIIDIIKDIEDSMKNISKNSFEKNKDKIEANVRRLEIMSKAIKNISTDLKDKYSHTEWKKFEKIEEILKNKYFGVDFNTVWDFINEDIPSLKGEIIKIKEKENKKR